MKYMFGGAKKWSERKVKSKKCKECGNEFTPFSGGNLYCDLCSPIVKKKHMPKHKENGELKTHKNIPIQNLNGI